MIRLNEMNKAKNYFLTRSLLKKYKNFFFEKQKNI